MSTNQNLQSDMPTILKSIVDKKKIWIENRKEQQPLQSFIDDILPSERDFYDALSQPHNHFIMECKKASPSNGVIRENYDLAEIAKVYNKYATVISVLTEEEHFHGNLEHIAKVKTYAKQPVLCKDFIVDEYQIYLARYYQADAILLMTSVLNEEEYVKLAKVAHELNMGVLTEADNETNLDMAIRVGAKVIGINNRNLRDLTIDLNNTRKLAPKIPRDRIVISESGIYFNHQVRDLSQYANAFLIGSSLMKQDNLEQAVRDMVFGYNKICGLTTNDHAVAAYDAGARYGGLIFIEKSIRRISLEQAIEIQQGVNLDWVAVVANMEIDQLVQYAITLKLHAIQLHGNEDNEYIAQLRQKLPNSVKLWRVYGITEDNQMPEIDTTNIDVILLDSKVGGKLGGTGQTFNWQLLHDVNLDIPIMLAGGLNVNNIRDAMLLPVLGLDVNSSLEGSAGVKDPKKIFEFMQYVRNYNHKLINQ